MSIDLLRMLRPGGWLAGARLVSGQCSAENPTGRAGEGCRRDPDPADPDLVHSGPAVDLGRGFKVRPYVPLAAGATMTLADLEGPGMITRLFLTANLADYGALRLRCFWDDAADPAVDVPIGQFFGVGHAGLAHTVLSLPVVVGPSRGCNCFWPMPFHRHARIALTNTSPDDLEIVAYSVSFARGAIEPATPHFFATYRQTHTSPDQPEHVLLEEPDVAGRYVGTSMSWTAISPGWWGEGEVKMYLDADTDSPSIVDTGTEDYFGGAWGFGRDAVHAPDHLGLVERPFQAPLLGCPWLDTDETSARRISLYRWHLPDPVEFGSGIRVTVQALGWGDDRRYRIRSDVIGSVAYWYRHG